MVQASIEFSMHSSFPCCNYYKHETYEKMMSQKITINQKIKEVVFVTKRT